jgi:hypothetical protein
MRITKPKKTEPPFGTAPFLSFSRYSELKNAQKYLCPYNGALGIIFH